MSDLDFDKALVVGPHPDDAEVLVGGTMAKWASQGKNVVLCVVTNGALGSNDPATERDDLIRTRKAEQLAAAEVLGLSDVVFLNYEDGFVEDSHELRRDLIREIRRHKPQIVVGLDPSTYFVQQWYVNHPDHRRTGETFLAAVNPGAATLPLYRSELYDQGFEPHRLRGCLLAGSEVPDHFVDIDEFIDIKIAALKAHRSQMDPWPEMEQTVRSMSEWMAAQSGEACRYAEGFKALFFPETDRDPSAGLQEQGSGRPGSPGNSQLPKDETQ